LKISTSSPKVDDVIPAATDREEVPGDLDQFSVVRLPFSTTRVVTTPRPGTENRLEIFEHRDFDGFTLVFALEHELAAGRQQEVGVHSLRLKLTFREAEVGRELDLLERAAPTVGDIPSPASANAARRATNRVAIWFSPFLHAVRRRILRWLDPSDEERRRGTGAGSS
jgi:hypothetical protein